MECPACHTPNIDGARFCAKCGALLPAVQKDQADPLIGSIVGGRFNVTGILGEGGMGRVYTAEQQMGTTTRKVAVKTLLSEYARDPKVVERFMRECATVVELEHPNTIKFFDYGKTDAGDLYIAMELLTGVSLEKALEGGALAPERVDRVLSQIAGSLQEAHDQGIVHRDLKPANIFLTTRAGESDYVKVLDFGIAKRDEKNSTKAEAKLTQQGTVLGTPPYMSPEQFRGGELDARSDIYSLGVMSYEMLTGRLPFDADTPWAWATQHMTAQPFPFETVPMGSAVPAPMKAAVMRALSKDKAHRQQTVKLFFEEFTLGGARGSSVSSGRASTPAGSVPPPAYGSGPQPAYGSGPQPAYGSGPQPSWGPPPGSQPVLGSGPVATYTTMPGRPITGEHFPSNPGMAPGLYPSSPGMAVPAGAYPGAPQVPAPPPAATRKSSGAAIGGIAAVVAVLGILGGVLFFRKRGVSGSETTATSATAAAPSVAPPAPPVDAGKLTVAEEDAGAPAASADAGPHIPGPLNPHAEQACLAAETAAVRNDLPAAHRHFMSCDGPTRAAAHNAIDQAEIRERNARSRPPPPPPCRGRHCPR